MFRLTWTLLLATFAIFWIPSSALGNDRDFSTRRPGYEIDDDEDGLEDIGKKQLLISSVEMTPFTQRSPAGGLEGVIPDLLEAMCDTGHMSCDYDLELSADGKFGTRDNQGVWDGMIGEVVKGQVDFAAAPIAVTDARRAAVNFSIPFAKTGLALVVNENDGITSLEDTVSKNITLGGVNGGSTLETLRNQPRAPYSSMWSKIDSDPNSRVSSAREGIDRVLKGGYAFLTESSTARFHVNRQCTLEQVGGTFLPGKGYAFAFPKDNDNLEHDINTALRMLKHDNKINAIYDKWFNAPCSACTAAPLKVALLVLAAVVRLLS